MKLELRLHLEPLVDSIFRGEFELGPLTSDEMVEICNVAANKLTPGEDEMLIGDEIDNLALWLGGINKDIQVYAWQLIRRVKGFAIAANDKTYVRLEPLEDKIFSGEPYEADTFENVRKFTWERTNTRSFDEILDDAQELAASLVDEEEALTSDLILSGQWHNIEVDINSKVQLIHDCCDALQDSLIDGKTNILYKQKLDHFIEWLMSIELELAVMGVRMAIKDRGLPINDKSAQWKAFVEYFKPILIS